MLPGFDLENMTREKKEIKNRMKFREENEAKEGIRIGRRRE